MKDPVERINVSSGTSFEALMGFSRLVQVGAQVFISGTTAINAKGEIIGVGDPYMQTKRVIDNIRNALSRIGANLTHVVRTRMFVTEISNWQLYCEAHREAFGHIKPALTMVQVERLVDPRMLISMEAEAILGEIVVHEEALERY